LEIIMLKSGATVALIALAALATASAASAKEYYVGEPQVKNGVQIVPNYLLGIEMASMVPGMSMAKDAIHLEADVHAAKNNPQKLAEDTWIPYLTIKYTITKPGDAKFKAITGNLQPMVAGDGLHYANGVKMPAPGKYHLTYTFSAPAIYRHADRETGVPEWWKPFSVDWDFNYPSKAK
jgi:uncharacterized protein involved in high-affinity Fe2+ transport